MDDNTFLAESAIGYASIGWHVFPLFPIVNGRCACSKPDCADPGKHPAIREWQKRATNDEQQVRQWWARGRGDWGIGLHCGPSGIIVIDVDPRHGGDDSLAALYDEHGQAWAATMTSITGGGGIHLFFRYNNQAITTGANLWPGIDFRHWFGFVVLPPSAHASGNWYEWEYGPGDELPMLDIPTHISERLTAKPKWTPNGTIHDGVRNVTLASLAGSLRRLGLDPEAIYAALQVQARIQCENPETISDAELRKMAISAGRYAPAYQVTANQAASRASRILGASQ